MPSTIGEMKLLLSTDSVFAFSQNESSGLRPFCVGTAGDHTDTQSLSWHRFQPDRSLATFPRLATSFSDAEA